MSKPTDYIGCHYYGFAYPSLVISHTSGVSSHACRSKFDPGTLVIVCAMGEDRNIYGFLGTALEVLTDKKPSDFWPGGVKNDASPVTKLKVLTPITLIPETVFSKMTQGGLMNVERSAVAQYIREYHNVITPVPQPELENTPPPSEAPRETPKPAVVDGKIGYVYVIENLQAQGYKIGITDNIHRRFRQLEVGTKANFIGYWSSENYKNLEKFLHTQFEPERVPQSEWFILDDAQLDWTCDWLDENASQVKCKLDSFESQVLPSWVVRTWIQVKEWFARTLTFA